MIYNKIRQQSAYLAGVAVAADMFKQNLIDLNDYSAMETEYAAKFLPLFRYEKPSFLLVILIRQSLERRRENGTHYS